MRELTQDEMRQVSGGDGMAIPGGSYLSTTRAITGGLGVVGAIDVSYRIGHALGDGINWATDRMFGISTTEALTNLDS